MLNIYTQPASPNGGAFARIITPFTASQTQDIPTGSAILNLATSTTIYLVGATDFTVSTMTVYGSITALPV
jgi:hypothetical protein